MSELTNELNVLPIVMARESCNDCGIQFLIPLTLKLNRLKDHDEFYCPNGHVMNYLDPDAEDERTIEEVMAENRELKLKVMKLTMDMDQSAAKTRDAQEKLEEHRSATTKIGDRSKRRKKSV